MPRSSKKDTRSVDRLLGEVLRERASTIPVTAAEVAAAELQMITSSPSAPVTTPPSLAFSWERPHDPAAGSVVPFPAEQVTPPLAFAARAKAAISSPTLARLQALVRQMKEEEPRRD